MRTSWRTLLVVAGVPALLLPIGARDSTFRADPVGQSPVPAWLEREMAGLVGGGGRWIADNTPYRSDGEPYDAYGLEWRWGIGRQSVTGRLFGLQDGREAGTFWEFRLFWHAGRGQALLLQWGGDGRFGEGPMAPTGAGVETGSVQVFHAPDGSRTRLRHLTVTENDEHRTRSFDDVDGRWVPRRTYVWRLVRPEH